MNYGTAVLQRAAVFVAACRTNMLMNVYYLIQGVYNPRKAILLPLIRLSEYQSPNYLQYKTPLNSM